MKLKTWMKEHKTALIIAGKAAIALGVNAAIIVFVCKRAYGDGVCFGAAVSTRATRKALDLSEDDIQKVIDMLPAAEKEILAEYGKKG